MKPVSWSLHSVTPNIVFIIDDNQGGRSVTNAADEVCRECYARWGERRIIYRDSEGAWDELIHDKGRFIDFRPLIDGGPDHRIIAHNPEENRK